MPVGGVEGKDVPNSRAQSPLHTVPGDGRAELPGNREADPGEPAIIGKDLQRERGL